MKSSWSMKHVDNTQRKLASESLPMGEGARLLEERELDAVVGGQGVSAPPAHHWTITNGGITHVDT